MVTVQVCMYDEDNKKYNPKSEKLLPWKRCYMSFIKAMDNKEFALAGIISLAAQ